MMTTHLLKITDQYYEDIQNGLKTFELRKNDRYFQVNDLIVFSDVSGTKAREGKYQIVYILQDVPHYGLDKDHVILGITRYDEY